MILRSNNRGWLCQVVAALLRHPHWLIREVTTTAVLVTSAIESNVALKLGRREAPLPHGGGDRNCPVADRPFWKKYREQQTLCCTIV
jgi:hypothetical protein